jgi:excisionase family DNA binding protein
MKDYITTTDAAKLLGVSPSRVRQYHLEGVLPGEKVGRDLVFKTAAVRKFRKPPRGRPKSAADKG